VLAQVEGRRRARNPAATREAILAAAQTMMAEHGPQRLTVSDVARRAAVNRGTAYQHFQTREQLVAAVLDRLYRTSKRVREARAPQTVSEYLDGVVEYIVGSPELLRLSLFRMLGGIPNPSEDLWADYLDQVRRFLAPPTGRADIDVEMLAVILLGATMLWALRVQSGAASAAENRRYLRELKRLLLYGAVHPAKRPDLVRALQRSEAPGRRRRGPSPVRIAAGAAHRKDRS